MNYSTGGWGDDANCLVEDHTDTSFIREPNDLERKRWALICSHCPVFDECLAWATRLDVRGVFAAGEWRE